MPQVYRKIRNVMFPGGSCEEEPEIWYSDDVTELELAAWICQNTCAALGMCRLFAAQHTWASGVVVAGWSAPNSRLGRRHYPPWRES